MANERKGVSSGPITPPVADSKPRDRMATVTDEVALEQARLQSFPTTCPPPGPAASTLPPARNMRDSDVEIDLGEQPIDTLGADEQVAILRARLAPLSRVPRLVRPLSELGTAVPDPQTAYVLGFVDGILPLETILEVTGVPELDTLRVLDRMLDLRLLVLRVIEL